MPTGCPLRQHAQVRQSVLYGRQQNESIPVVIEAQADEEFGPLIGPYRTQRANTRSKAPEWIDALPAAILGSGTTRASRIMQSRKWANHEPSRAKTQLPIELVGVESPFSPQATIRRRLVYRH